MQPNQREICESLTTMESWGFSVLALVISVMSLGFAVFSWRESHRPIVTVRLQAREPDNFRIPLELIVENTGNRPAINVRFAVDSEDLGKAFWVPRGDLIREDIEYLLSGEPFISCLNPGQAAANAFGILFRNEEEDSTWVYKSVLNIEITYSGMKERWWSPRNYKNVVPIWLVDNSGFSLSYWGRKER